MIHLMGQGKNRKATKVLKLIKRRTRDSFSTPDNIFLKYASYMVPDDAKKKYDEAFLYRDKKEKYKYATMEQLPCGDMFRNKHHMQFDPTADWHVPINDIYFMSRKKKEDEKKKPPLASTKPKVKPAELTESFEMRPGRMTDRRKSMNPRGIYKRPPMNPDPKGMYNGFGRKTTFIPPSKLQPFSSPVVESSTSSENEEERAPMKVRIKDLFKGHDPKKKSMFMALKLKDLQKSPRQSFTDVSTPTLTPPSPSESSSSSEPKQKYQKLVKRRVKDRVHNPCGSASSRSSIFIKWERMMEDVDEVQCREPLFEYGGMSNGSNIPKKRVKANYEKYAICYRKHQMVADICLACEKDETYNLFTKSMKTEPWKLPRGRPDPRDMKVACSLTDKKKRQGTPHSQLPVCYMFDHEVDHTFHAKEAANIANEKIKMRKHLSKTLRKFHCHLYKPEQDFGAVISKFGKTSTKHSITTRLARTDGPAKDAMLKINTKPAVYNPSNVCYSPNLLVK